MAHIPRDKFGSPITSQDLSISMEVSPVLKPFSSLGERTNTGTAATGEDVTEIASQDVMPVPNPTTGEQMTIVSDDADDTAAGTGVQSVRIEYLDINGNEQTEDLIMDGTSEVDTVATDITFVNDMYALTVGTGTIAAGDITIYKKGDNTTIYNMLLAGGNKSLVINRKIPANKTLYITSWTLGVNGNNVMSARLRATCTPEGNEVVEGFLFKRTIKTGGDSAFYEKITPPIKICAGSLVKVSLWSAGSNNDVSASFSGILAG